MKKVNLKMTAYFKTFPAHLRKQPEAVVTSACGKFGIVLSRCLDVVLLNVAGIDCESQRTTRLVEV